MSITLTLRTEEEIRDQLDQIAEALDRNRNWIINEAIENYLDLHRWQLEEIRKGEEDIKAGRSFTTAQVRSRLAAHMNKRDKERNRK